MAPPAPTARLTFHEMALGDLDDMAHLLGDPDVMRFYGRPKTRTGAKAWIEWNLRLYAAHGHGLWLLRLRGSGEFVGDCGLTPQQVDGRTYIEVGYHVRPSLHGQGLATEAALACRAYAADRLGLDYLIAIIDPGNRPSQRVAEKIGLTAAWQTTIADSGRPCVIYAPDGAEAASCIHVPTTYESCRHVEGPFFHGTKSALEVGDELVPGYHSNFQDGRVSNNIYFTSLVDTAAWGAELSTALAGSDERGHIYVVEPLGPFEDDPNVTNKRFPGNPTKSYRTRHSLRVVGEVDKWEGHQPEVLKGMLERLALLREQGLDVIED